MNRDAYLLVAIAALLAAGTGAYVMARGIRNHNPGNIRRSGDVWQGLSPVQTDSEYFQFTKPEWGIRAMARILRNYQSRYGLNSIEEIISRWAPPNENITGAYVTHVAKLVGVDPRAIISVNDHLPELISAIIRHENGFNPYSPETIANGIALA